jgi:hypothetical protein
VQQFKIDPGAAAHVQPLHLRGLCQARAAGADGHARGQLALESDARSAAMNELDNMLWYLDPRKREQALQAARDISEAHGRSTLEFLEAIHIILRPSMNGILSFWKSCKRLRPRADIRHEKRERRQARHYFMTHGKHGLKRPRGRRNVARD